MSFSVFRAIGLVLRTWPFLLVRMAVSALMVLIFSVIIGVYAAIGWSVGHLWPSNVSVQSACFGGFIGFLAACGVGMWLRSWLVYFVKAGHVAALTVALDGGPLPLAFGQVSFALAVVRERFLEVNALFALDQLVKAAAASVTGIAAGIVGFSRVPGLDGLLGFLGAVLRTSTQFVDEIILAYNVRNQSKNPWSTAQDALVLYAQNGWTILGNAIGLTVLMAFAWVVLFVMLVAPALAWVLVQPGTASYAGLIASAILAYGFTKAFVEPFCIACLMQVFFATTKGEVPDAEWRARLDGLSDKFRDLGERAAQGVTGA